MVFRKSGKHCISFFCHPWYHHSWLWVMYFESCYKNIDGVHYICGLKKFTVHIHLDTMCELHIKQYNYSCCLKYLLSLLVIVVTNSHFWVFTCHMFLNSRCLLISISL